MEITADIRSQLPAGIEIADTPETREEVARFRYEVYYEECRREAAGIDHARRVIHDPGDEDGIVLYARKEGRVVGTVRVDFGATGRIPQQVRDWFDLDRFSDYPDEAFAFSYKLMIDPAWRSSPVTGQLVKACYVIGRAHGSLFAFCASSPHLVKLYEMMGFRRYKDNMSVAGHGYQVPYVCVVQDVEHLEQVRSPFAKLARQWDNSPVTREWFLEHFPRVPGHVSERVLGEDGVWDHVRSQVSDDASALLRGLSQEDARCLLSAGTILRARAGDRIMGQDEVANDLIVVLSGAAEVRRHFGGGQVPVTRVSRGQVAGVHSFVNDEPRAADVVALTDMEFLVLTPQMVDRALRGNERAKAALHANLRSVIHERLGLWIDAVAAIQRAA